MFGRDAFIKGWAYTQTGFYVAIYSTSCFVDFQEKNNENKKLEK